MEAHVVKLGSGTKRAVQCKYCSHKLPNNKDRWKSHLQHCIMAPIIAAETQTKRKAVSSSIIQVREDDTCPPQSVSCPAWVDSMSGSEKIVLDKAFANIWYSTGVPFRLAKSPALAKFVSLLRPAYNPPSSKTIAGSLLNNAHNEMTARLNEFMHDQDLVSLVSDGWTSQRNDHMVNFVAVFPTKSAKPVFVKAVNTAETAQTGENIAKELEIAMKSIGI